jgi:hypothetical protein
MKEVSILARSRAVYVILLLLGLGGAVLFGGTMRAGAQASSTLVDSIITSTNTDNPPRFCWVQQYNNTKGRDPAAWQPIEETKARAFDLDEFRDGNLDFGPDFAETNILVLHPNGLQAAWRLHRVPCPQPAAVCPGNDHGSWCRMMTDKLLQARFIAIATILTNPALRDQISKSLGDESASPPVRKHKFLGGILSHVTVGVGVGGSSDHGGHRDNGHVDKPSTTDAPPHPTGAPHD